MFVDKCPSLFDKNFYCHRDIDFFVAYSFLSIKSFTGLRFKMTIDTKIDYLQRIIQSSQTCLRKVTSSLVSLVQFSCFSASTSAIRTINSITVTMAQNPT